MSWYIKAFGLAKSVLLGNGDGAKNIAKAASFIGEQIDQRNYTEEEMAEHNKEQLNGFRSWFKSTLSENTQRSLTRRNVTNLVTRLCVGMTVFSVGIWKYSPEWASFTLTWFKIWWPILAGIGVFFYGTHFKRADKGK